MRTIIILLLLLLNEAVVAAPQILSISGAGFRSVGNPVTEVDGCYSGVNNTNIDVPVGSLLTGIDISVNSTDGIGQVRFIMIKYNLFMFDGFQLDENVKLQIGTIKRHFPIEPNYFVKDNDFILLNYTQTNTQNARLCGVKISYLPPSEFIFINGFE
jgi:hypothetical protein